MNAAEASVALPRNCRRFSEDLAFGFHFESQINADKHDEAAFGLRREAQRHAAFGSNRSPKAVSRCALGTS